MVRSVIRLIGRGGQSLTALGLVAYNVSAADGIAVEDVQRWLSRQTNITTWSAEVVQTRRLKSLADPLVTPGRVWFRAPNLFRWELGAPARTIAIREPDRLVLLYPQLRRAEVYSLTGAKDGPWRSSLTLLEAGFPQQQGQLEKQFEILDTASEGTNTIVKLKPKSREARRWVTGVRVTLAAEDLVLRATELEFADGSRLRNDFRNSRINLEMPADHLTASIPAEYTVAHPSE